MIPNTCDRCNEHISKCGQLWRRNKEGTSRVWLLCKKCRNEVKNEKYKNIELDLILE